MFSLVIIKVITTESCARVEDSSLLRPDLWTLSCQAGKMKFFHCNSKPRTLSVKASVLIKVLLYPALSEFSQKEQRDKIIIHDTHLFY